MTPGDLVVVLSDLQSRDQNAGMIRSVQVRRVSTGPEGFLTTRAHKEKGLLS